MTTKVDRNYWRYSSKRMLIQHLQINHGHIDSAGEMAKWDRDELERAHIDAHREVTK